MRKTGMVLLVGLLACTDLTAPEASPVRRPASVSAEPGSPS